MKDEAKKILEKIKSVSDFDDYVDFKGTEFKPLLDGITNLQENARGQVNNYFKDKYCDEVLKNVELTKENESLKERNIELHSKEKELLSDWHKKNNEAVDYKSRCEKAIEYLANCDWNNKDFENLYDILKGGDDNE